MEPPTKPDPQEHPCCPQWEVWFEIGHLVPSTDTVYEMLVCPDPLPDAPPLTHDQASLPSVLEEGGVPLSTAATLGFGRLHVQKLQQACTSQPLLSLRLNKAMFQEQGRQVGREAGFHSTNYLKY